ncbi:GNAT family N-acetyltransferase [Candidatus Omnitrophota bacterium]
MPSNSPKNSIIFNLSRVWNKVRHGLALQEIRNCLGRIGLDIIPYYWVQEGLDDSAMPKVKCDLAGSSLEFFGPEEMKIIGTKTAAYSESKLLTRLEKGQKCFGMKYNGEIVAFMWFIFGDFILKPQNSRLNEREVYLCDMYTMREFRGRGAAPYLRYQSYKILRKMGRDTFYSVTEFFNKSAMKFKKKLNAKLLNFCLCINLFGKAHWKFIIKNY